MMILADGLILFLPHLERYLVYEKGYQVGHCHQLCLLLVRFMLSTTGKKPQDDVKLLFSQFLQAYHQLFHAKKGNWTKGIIG